MKIWHRKNYYDLYRPNFSYLFLSSKTKTKPLEIQKRLYKKPFANDVWGFTDVDYWKKCGAFPPIVAEMCIKAFTNEGDTVLDPYAGTGTSLLVADKLNRHGVGYEIDVSLKPIFEHRKVTIESNSGFTLEHFV
jgi:DNA modification methylase